MAAVFIVLLVVVMGVGLLRLILMPIVYGAVVIGEEQRQRTEQDLVAHHRAVAAHLGLINPVRSNALTIGFDPAAASLVIAASHEQYIVVLAAAIRTIKAGKDGRLLLALNSARFPLLAIQVLRSFDELAGVATLDSLVARVRAARSAASPARSTLTAQDDQMLLTLLNAGRDRTAPSRPAGWWERTFG